MFSTIPHSVIQKNTCIHKEKQCNHLKAYNNLELYGDSRMTDQEKENNLKRYNKSCDNRNGTISICCDKNDTKVEDVLNKMKFKRPLGKTNYNKFGQLESIDFCLEDDTKKCASKFKKLSSYEICKIPEKNNELKDGRLTNFNPDCYQAKCNPQENTFNIGGVMEEDYTYEFDKEVAHSIKHNKLTNLKKFLQQDKTLLNRPLTHSSEGNTIYHESLKHNAEHILVYLFTNITPDIANRLNSEGNTILHMVMAKDNKNILMLILKLGADINAVNNKGETPIFNAIIEGLYDNIRLGLNYSANIYHKNNEGNSLLFVALQTPKRDLRIIKLLVDNGSDIEEIHPKTEIPVFSQIHMVKNKTVRDASIENYIKNKLIQKRKIPLGKELDKDTTESLKGLLYDLEDEDKTTKKYDFNITIDFEEKDLKFPKDLHYPKDLEENKMQPFKIGDKYYSHEPYFIKKENLEKEEIKKLQKTIQLTKWDNNNNKDRKLQIIDEIMSGKLELDDYKRKVIIENKITKEQEYLLNNISEDDIIDFESPMFSPSAEEEVILTTKIEDNKQKPTNIETTKRMEIPKEEPISEPPRETFYDQNAYILLAVCILISIGVLFMIYKFATQKKLDFFI